MASGMRFGQYELGSRLAAGGMGEVFIARRRGAAAFEKEVALKLLLPHLAEDPEFVTRFFDEARLVARMNHPNIVQIFDVGETDGRPYLAMALVEGVSLATLIRAVSERHEAVPLPLVRLIATGILEALTHAHGLTDASGQSLDVIHRDVSPSNVLLSSAGAVLLNDFGLAKATTNLHATRPGTLRGKAAYLAPEQLRSAGVVTRQADLFSTGATLYQLLTLVSPFWRASDMATMEAVLREVPAPLSQLRKDATSGMAAALDRALEKASGDRFPSARTFREAFVDGPVATAPELGEYVASRCAQALAVFRASTGAPVAEVHTASLATEPSALPPRRRRRWPWALAGLASAGVLAVGWLVEAPAGSLVEASAPDATVDAAPPVDEEAAEPAIDTTEERPDSTADAGSPTPRRRVERPPRSSKRLPTPAPVRLGYLTADARPWAAVLLDGREIERTPLSRFPVPIGRHRLILRGPGGELDTHTIVVEEGRVVTVQASFADPKR